MAFFQSRKASFLATTLFAAAGIAQPALAQTVVIDSATALGAGDYSATDGTTFDVTADNLTVSNNIALGAQTGIDTGTNGVTLAGTLGDQAQLFNYVGQWQVDQGPNWTSTPSAYTGQEAAAYLFGGTASDYAISTSGTNADSVNRLAWVSVWGGISGCSFPCGREVNDSSVISTNGLYQRPGDESAFVTDWARGAQFTNYAFTITQQAAPATLTKTGSGTLILQGANTYTGGTELQAGTIQVENDSALGTGGLTMADGTTLTAGVDGLALANAVTIAGVSTVDTGAFAFQLDGTIDGTGSLAKAGTGNLILNGDNTYSGGTALNAGTITVGSDTALGTGDLAMADSTTLSAGVDGLVIANNISIAGTSTVDTGANTFTLAGTISDGMGRELGLVGSWQVDSGPGWSDSPPDGPLAYTGQEAAALLFGGTASDYSISTAGIDPTQINNLSWYSVIGYAGDNGSGGILRAENYTSKYLGQFYGPTSGYALQDPNAAASAYVWDNAAGPQFTNYAFSLMDVVVPGQLAKTGSGTLILQGADTYTGGTDLQAGTIQVENDSALGTGGLAMADGTTLTAGVDTLTLANNVSIAGISTVDSGAFTFRLNGTVSGTGTLAKAGSGNLILAAANTYSGGTKLNAGSITVLNNQSLGSGALTMADGTALVAGQNNLQIANAIVTNGTGTIATGSNTLTLAGVIANGTATGSLGKTGSGTLILQGANTYTGGTALQQGTIQVAHNSALGTGTLALSNGTTLRAGAANLQLANAIGLTGTGTVDTGSYTLTLGGALSGTGGFTKSGTGMLTLGGTSTHTGPTNITAGSLNLTGTLASAVTMAAGTTLYGNGRAGALTVASGATVAPGTPGSTDIATLNVTGAAALLGTYRVNVGTTTADRITAGGALSLGGTLVVTAGGSPFATFNQTYTIASGSTRTGTFGTVTGLDGFGTAFTPTVVYTGTQAQLRLAPRNLTPMATSLNVAGNPLEVARMFDRATAAGYNPQAFYPLYASTGTPFATALSALSGEQRATERRVALDTNRVVRDGMLERLNGGRAGLAAEQSSSADGQTVRTLWQRANGSWGTSEADATATAFNTRQQALMGGVDWKKDALTVGGMVNYTNTDIDYRTLGGSSNVTTIGAALYAGLRADKGTVLNFGASIANARSRGTRSIALPGLEQSLRGETRGTTYQFFGELGWDLVGSSTGRLEPFARIAHVEADMGALSEVGGVAALTAGRQDYSLTVKNVGLRAGGELAKGRYAIDASASWQSTAGDRDAATLLGIPATGQEATIRSVAVDRNAFALQASLGARLSGLVRLELGYSGLFGKTFDDHGVRGTLRITF